MGVNEVAAVFREFGDVTVVKQAEGVFWIDYEEFTGDMSIERIREQVQSMGLGVLNNADAALRFTD